MAAKKYFFATTENFLAMKIDFLVTMSDFFVTTPDCLVTNTELPCDKTVTGQTCGAGDATTFAVLPAPRALSKVSNVHNVHETPFQNRKRDYV